MISAKNTFDGFFKDSSHTIQLPETFFTQLLSRLEDLASLKLLLYLFWYLEKQNNKNSHFRWADLISDPALLHMVGDEEKLLIALKNLVSLKAVLMANIEWMDETYYFLNTPLGQASVKAIHKGAWKETTAERKAIHLPEKTPNIFELYEQNIGVITPMLAEVLKEDEATYPADWVKEAIQIAVTRNVRTWNYVQAILKRWQKEGYGDEQNRQNGSQDPESYRKSWLNR